MRVSETVNLRVGDVDLVEGIVTVKAGKFGKDRRVPMSADLTQRCRSYAAAVHRFPTTDQYFFRVSRDSRPVSVSTVYFNFREFLLDAGISYRGKGKGPRLHDLRHTFAVHCLRSWVAEGKDLSAYLPILQTYLGHSHLKQTTQYLRLTTDLYPAIRDQIEERFATMIPRLGDNE
jgi:integrase